MPKNRYVYIVTRYTYYEPKNAHAIPNLGVHAKKSDAISHFCGIIADRSIRGTLYWDIEPDPGPIELQGRCIVLREALIDNGEYGKENLRLERWKL